MPDRFTENPSADPRSGDSRRHSDCTEEELTACGRVRR